MSVPESILKNSSARWLLPPAPEDQPGSWPGFALAIAISSFRFAAGNVALVSNMIGDQPSSVTEAKSSGRQGVFARSAKLIALEPGLGISSV
jgi:hypothetical protein